MTNPTNHRATTPLRAFGARKRHRNSIYCSATGKRRYRDAREATAGLHRLRNAAHRLDEQGSDHTIHVKRKYKCSACSGWHLTSWATPGGAREPGDARGVARDVTPLVAHQQSARASSLLSPRHHPVDERWERNRAICARRAQGDTLAAIAHDFGLTRERVRQIIRAAGGPSSATARAERAAKRAQADHAAAERLRDLYRRHPAASRSELAALSGVPTDRIKDLLGDDARFLVSPKQRARQYSDDDIFSAMRAAAGLFDGPLSHQRYASVSAEVGGPSVPRILQRFGTWLQACEQAGVQAGRRPKREYHRKWSPGDVLGWVATYLGSPDCPGTYQGYDQWARGTIGAPSAATMRNTLGPWSDVKRAAALLVRADEPGAA